MLMRSQRHNICPCPFTLYNDICPEKTNTALFTTTNVENKTLHTSTLVTKTAIRIEYDHPNVTLFAVSDTGYHFLNKLFGHSRQDIPLTITLLDPKECYYTDVERLRQSSAFDSLRKLLSIFQDVKPSLKKYCRLVGIFSFDLITAIEKLAPISNNEHQYPLFVFFVPEEMVIIEHDNHMCHYLVLGNEHKLTSFVEQCHSLYTQKENDFPENNSCLDVANVASTPTRSEFVTLVEQCKQHIHQGDVFQIVLSRQFSLPCSDPYAAFTQLVNTNFSSYLFYLQTPQHTLFGASPETSVKVIDHQLTLCPIAGTRPRGINNQGKIDNDHDMRQETSLKLDHKELAEHMMLVDLARNDIARVCETGSCQVTALTEVIRTSKVMHLGSTVQGKLQPDLDALHAYRACLNMGTLTGAPKLKATSLLQGFEKVQRGPYGGAIGWINAHNEMDTAIIIRSALVYQNIAYVRAGAGIVFDSHSINESLETEYKASAVLQAIHQSQRGVYA